MDKRQKNDQEIEKLERRITRLEKQNRFWKGSGILALVVLAFSLVRGLPAQEAQRAIPLRAETVEAQHFLLKGADGATLGEWSATPGGGKLVLYSPNGDVIWSSSPRVMK